MFVTIRKNAKGHLFSAKEYFEMTERKGTAKTEKRRGGTKKGESK